MTRRLVCVLLLAPACTGAIEGAGGPSEGTSPAPATPGPARTPDAPPPPSPAAMAGPAAPPALNPPPPSPPISESFSCEPGGALARMAGALSAIRKGDRSIFDNMAILYLSDSGDEHHSDYRRFPVVVLGDAGGRLRSDGRYLRFPDKGSAGARSLPDLYCSLATALGAPTDRFGAGGAERVQGPLAEIMV